MGSLLGNIATCCEKGSNLQCRVQNAECGMQSAELGIHLILPLNFGFCHSALSTFHSALSTPPFSMPRAGVEPAPDEGRVSETLASSSSATGAFVGSTRKTHEYPACGNRTRASASTERRPKPLDQGEATRVRHVGVLAECTPFCTLHFQPCTGRDSNPHLFA